MGELILALSKSLGVEIVRADYKETKFKGGTVGDVRHISGNAFTSNGEETPFNVVLKIQKKWERCDDPDSWRREYDLYSSGLGSVFSDSLRWPECYHSEIKGDETRLWLEYIKGAHGAQMTVDMYERAAFELGRFQGRLYAQKPAALNGVTNLSETDFMEKFYIHNKSFRVVFDYIRSYECEIPKHLCKMIIDADKYAYKIFRQIKKFPVVFCHRDFWFANIYYCGGKIVLIDWDTTGWGYLGEDIISLIADETDIEHMLEYYQKCVPAYRKGFSEFSDISHIGDLFIHERIIINFGYRLVKWFIQTENPEVKKLQIDTLQKIYEFEYKSHIYGV